MMQGSLRGMIIFVLVLFVLYLIMKIRHEKQRKKMNSRFGRRR